MGWRQLQSKGLIAVMITSIASGLPLLLASQTLQAWYTQSGVSLVSIGALSFVSLPYILKFLWAPLMDRFALFSDHRRRDWLLLTQALLITVLVVLSGLSPRHHALLIVGLALLLAFFSASQDIVVDGYRVDVLSAKQRGLGAAVQMLGYRVGMLLSGAFALTIAAAYSWSVMFLLMAIILLLVMSYCIALPRTVVSAPSTTVKRGALLQPYRELLSRKHIVIIVLFVLLYKISDNLVFNLNMTFLLRRIGFSLMQVGAASNVISVVGVSLGSILAGVLLYRVSVYRCLMWFGWLQLISNLGYVLLAVVGKSMSMMVLTFLIENFCGGMATAAFIAFLTGLCDQRFSASQYAMFSVLMAVPRIVFGPLMALLIQQVGWIDFYLFSCVIGLPPLLLLWHLKHGCHSSSQVIFQDL